MIYSLKKNTNNSGVNIKYLIVFGLGMMLFGHNDVVNIVSIAIITSALILNIDKDEFILSYFALIFFEPILVVPIIGGSFFRIYQLLFIFRIINDILKKIKYKTYLKLNLIASFLFLFLSLFYSINIDGLVSMSINVFILVYITVSFRPERKETIINKIFVYVAFFSILSGVYGFLYIDSLDYGYVSRSVGIMGDPNYSALFYTLGIFAVIGNDLISPKIKMIFLISLLTLLVSTISLSGIIGIVLLLSLYFWVLKPRKGLMVVFAATVSFFIFMSLNYDYGSSLYAFKYRVETILQSTDLDIITSSRSSLAAYYISNFLKLPLKNQFFGGNNTISGEYRESMINQIGNVSHSSYIDMLYMVGILGTTIIIGLFVLMIVKNIENFQKTNNKAYLTIAFAKIIILYYGLSISIFPFRYFYTFFLL